VTPRRENAGDALRAIEPHLTWIGHSTFVMRLGGKLVATDPVWSERVGPVKRNTAPGVALANVPPLDVVTVSHSHYDHMDLPTLTKLGKDAVFVVPKDNGEILTRAGIERVVELDWWESFDAGALKITLVPAQHWSIRVPWDRNRRLWGGFVYESNDGTAYHAGDTAFNERVFREIGARFPNIDWAMIPIGAYDPEWFMSSQHIGPEDAGRAWEILGARTLVAMHWGTFRLTDEPLGEPPERARAWFEEHGHATAPPRARLWILDIGETRVLSRG
jgi:L-ascorbate metabolism protein UlaG (beta-lactamase superfamily)